jgi:hypothetical protein
MRWHKGWRERMDGLLYLTLRGLAVAIAVIDLCALSGAVYQRFAELSDLKRTRLPGSPSILAVEGCTCSVRGRPLGARSDRSRKWQ